MIFLYVTFGVLLAVALGALVAERLVSRAEIAKQVRARIGASATDNRYQEVYDMVVKDLMERHGIGQTEVETLMSYTLKNRVRHILAKSN